MLKEGLITDILNDWDLSELETMGLNYVCNTYRSGDAEICVVVFDTLFKGNIAGLVMSDLFSLLIPIVLKETDEDTVDLASLAIIEEGKQPIIFFDKNYFIHIKALTDEVLTILFHELGHLNNGDLINFSVAAYNDKRIQFATRQDILPMEKKADDFAVSFLGRETVSAGLASVKSKIETCEGYDNFEMALREMEERIRRLS